MHYVLARIIVKTEAAEILAYGLVTTLVAAHAAGWQGRLNLAAILARGFTCCSETQTPFPPAHQHSASAG